MRLRFYKNAGLFIQDDLLSIYCKSDLAFDVGGTITYASETFLTILELTAQTGRYNLTVEH